MANIALQGRKHHADVTLDDERDAVTVLCRGPINQEFGGFDYPNPCGKTWEFFRLSDALLDGAVNHHLDH